MRQKDLKVKIEKAMKTYRGLLVGMGDAGAPGSLQQSNWFIYHAKLNALETVKMALEGDSSALDFDGMEL